VLVLRVAMQFSAEETARAVGSTPGAVRVTQHRALTKLRTMMAQQQLSKQTAGQAT
jgi:RNA polymerase sigma-70 factor (ECF subfamily)